MKKRILSFLLALCLAAGLMPMSTTTAFAAGTNKSIMPGVSHLAPSDGSWDPTNDYKVYFGKFGFATGWGGSTNTELTAYRVLDISDSTMLLDADKVFSTAVKFDDGTVNNGQTKYKEYNGSDIQIWLNGDEFYNSTFFTDIERAAITKSELQAVDTPYSVGTQAAQYVDQLSNNYVFPLSARESDSYYAADAARIKKFSNANGYWLRSANADESINTVATVQANGMIVHNNVDYGGTGVSPAFNLDTSKVLFTSQAVGGKTATTLSPITDYTGKEWKTTLLDSSRSAFAAQATAKDGNIWTVSYENAKTGSHEYISVMIADSAGAYTHYGKLLQLDGSTNGASGTIDIDLSGIDMTDKTLYVFNEQCNGNQMTDYSSALVAVGFYCVSVSNQNATTYYDSLEAAINAAQNGDTVKLLEDVSGVSGLVINKNITLDLNDKSLTVAALYGVTIDTAKSVTIATGTSGKVIEGAEYPIKNLGTLTTTGHGLSCSLKNEGTISGGVYNAPVNHQGVITGGTFNSVVDQKGTLAGGCFGGSVICTSNRIYGGLFANSLFFPGPFGGSLPDGYGWLANTDETTKGTYPYKVAEAVTITFKSNYTGGEADKTQIVEKNVATNLIANPFARTGYKFEYWATTGGKVYYDKATAAFSADTDLYATWTLCNHSGSTAKPTCTQSAVCSVCGGTIAVDADNHNWKNGVCKNGCGTTHTPHVYEKYTLSTTGGLSVSENTLTVDWENDRNKTAKITANVDTQITIIWNETVIGTDPILWIGSESISLIQDTSGTKTINMNKGDIIHLQFQNYGTGTLTLSFSDGKAPAATCTKGRVCTVCGHEGEKLPHTYDQEIATDTYLKSEADCTNAAVYYKSCVCGLSSEGTQDAPTFTSGSANGHSYIHHDKVTATHESDGKAEYYTCENCTMLFDKDKNVVTAEDLVIAKIDHSFGTEWKSDADKHWHECECGEKSSELAHTFEWVTDKEAEEGVAGSKHEECTVCGYKKAAVEIPALPLPEYPPVIETPDGGKVEIDNLNPQPGDKVTITLKPSDGKQIDRIVVTDKNGSPIDVIDNGDGTYAFTQPDNGAVTIKVTFKDLPTADVPHTGGNDNMWLWIALMCVSCGGIIMSIVYSNRKKQAE